MTTNTATRRTARRAVSPDALLRQVAGTSTRACVDRIVATFNKATASDIERGAAWYADGETFIRSLAAETSIPVDNVAAVVAHLSPRTTWQRNLYGATMLLTTGTAPTCIAANVDRARRALDSDTPRDTFGKGAPKTRRFMANLLGERDVVTVDVWAARVALGPRDDAEQVLGRVGVYDAIERAYQIAAQRLAVDPVTVQATTWIVARGGRAN
jgi:hypothetical protein